MKFKCRWHELFWDLCPALWLPNTASHSPRTISLLPPIPPIYLQVQHWPFLYLPFLPLWTHRDKFLYPRYISCPSNPGRWLPRVIRRRCCRRRVRSRNLRSNPLERVSRSSLDSTLRSKAQARGRTRREIAEKKWGIINTCSLSICQNWALIKHRKLLI